MSPIPGKGHDAKPHELTTADGKKVVLKVPGLEPPGGSREAVKPPPEPPRDDTRPPVDPHTGVM